MEFLASVYTTPYYSLYGVREFAHWFTRKLRWRSGARMPFCQHHGLVWDSNSRHLFQPLCHGCSLGMEWACKCYIFFYLDKSAVAAQRYQEESSGDDIKLSPYIKAESQTQLAVISSTTGFLFKSSKMVNSLNTFNSFHSSSMKQNQVLYLF